MVGSQADGMSHHQRIIAVLAVLLILTPTAWGSDIDARIDQLILSIFRTETHEEYERLTRDYIEMFWEIDTLILDNPSLHGNETGVVDESGLGKKMDAVKEGCKGFVDVSLSNNKKVALVYFSDSAKIDSLLTKNRNILHSKIDMYLPKGDTCIECGIHEGIRALSGSPGDLVLISDGYNSAGRNPAISEAENARTHGVKIYAIALGDTADKVLLRNISETTGGEFYEIQCEEPLKDIYREISAKLNDSVLVVDVSRSMADKFSLECIEEKHICGLRCLMNRIILLLELVYVTLIISTGFYLIFLSGTPEGRSKAKSTLLWLVLSMMVIPVSPGLLSFLFGVSHALTSSVLSYAPFNAKEIFIEAIDFIISETVVPISHLETPSMPLLTAPYMILNSLLLMLRLRFYIVLLFSVLLPFAILLYPFGPTRGIGRFLLEQVILWTFSQVAMAVVFVMSAIGINITASIVTNVIPEFLRVIMEFSALLLLILTPIAVAVGFRRFLP